MELAFAEEEARAHPLPLQHLRLQFELRTVFEPVMSRIIDKLIDSSHFPDLHSIALECAVEWPEYFPEFPENAVSPVELFWRKHLPAHHPLQGLQNWAFRELGRLRERRPEVQFFIRVEVWYPTEKYGGEVYYEYWTETGSVDPSFDEYLKREFPGVLQDECKGTEFILK